MCFFEKCHFYLTNKKLKLIFYIFSTKGEKGDNFFFIEEGEAIATKKINESEETVYKYKEGDYFGELALLRETPRAANIIATVCI